MNSKELINLQEAYLEIYENIGTGKAKRSSFGGISQRPSEREIRDIRAAARRKPEPIPEEKPRQKRKGIGVLPSAGVEAKSKVLRGGYGRTTEGIARRRATELNKRSRRLDLSTPEVIQASKRAAKIKAALKKSKKWGTPEAAEEVILGYLIDEGFVDSLESAEVILENMSDEWLQSIFEARVPWNDPKNPNPSGYTPREKLEAKRKQLGIEDPNKLSFEKGGPSESDYSRYANLSSSQEKMDKESRKIFGRLKGKSHSFKKNPFWKKTTGQVRRQLFGTTVPKNKRKFYPSNIPFEK